MSEWIAFYQLEPFGHRASWLRTGVVASIIANVNRRKGIKATKPEDFMPDERTTKVQSVEQQRGALKRIFAWAKKVGKVKK